MPPQSPCLWHLVFHTECFPWWSSRKVQALGSQAQSVLEATWASTSLCLFHPTALHLKAESRIMILTFQNPENFKLSWKLHYNMIWKATTTCKVDSLESIIDESWSCSNKIMIHEHESTWISITVCLTDIHNVMVHIQNHQSDSARIIGETIPNDLAPAPILLYGNTRRT